MSLSPGTPGQPPRGVASPQKLIGLEVLRFGAALGVLVWHYTHFYASGGGNDVWTEALLPFHAPLRLFYEYGDSGVRLFWCISGFIFAWRYGAAIRLREVSLSTFMILRFSRLYPLQVACLLAVAVLQSLYFGTHGKYFIYSVNDAKHFVLNVLFAQHWGFQDGASFNGPSWSISLELLVYVLFFGCASLARPTLVSALVTTMLLCGAGLAVHAVFGAIPEVLFAALFFYVGVITCYLHALILSRNTGGMVFSALSLAAILLSGYCIHAGILKLGWTGHDVFPAIVLFPAMVLLAQLVVPDRYPSFNAVLTFLGDLTYSSYMVHFPMQLILVQAVERLGLEPRSILYAPGFFLLYLASVFVVAWAVFHWFERPAQTFLRRAMLYRRVSPA